MKISDLCADYLERLESASGVGLVGAPRCLRECPFLGDDPPQRSVIVE